MNARDFWFAKLFILIAGILIYSMPSQYRIEAVEEQRLLEEELKSLLDKETE